MAWLYLILCLGGSLVCFLTFPSALWTSGPGDCLPSPFFFLECLRVSSVPVLSERRQARTLVKAWLSLHSPGLRPWRPVLSCQHCHQKWAVADALAESGLTTCRRHSTAAVASLWVWSVLSLRLVLACDCVVALKCCFAVAADLYTSTLFASVET